MDPEQSPTHKVCVDAKKAYAAPRLAVYGDIRVITHSMMNSGADGGTRGVNTRSV